MTIFEVDTSSYSGNEVLNDAARRGNLAAVKRLIVDQSDYIRWIATGQALLNRRWKVVDALMDAGLGDFGRNNLLEHVVSLGVLEWTERLLREGTSKQARGFALNRLAEWQRDSGVRPVELVDEHHACLRAVLAAGVTVYDRRRARKKALANGDDLLAGWLADSVMLKPHQNRLSDIRKKIAEKKAEEKAEAERLQALNQQVRDGLQASLTGRINKQRAATKAKKKAALTSKPIPPKSKK